MARRAVPQEDRVQPFRQNRRQFVIVSYDIVDDKRRKRIMKILEGYGRRAQYSVFECELRTEDLRRLQARLQEIINEGQDDVRFYLLCDSCVGRVVLLGRAALHRYSTHLTI